MTDRVAGQQSSERRLRRSLQEHADESGSNNPDANEGVRGTNFAVKVLIDPKKLPADKLQAAQEEMRITQAPSAATERHLSGDDQRVPRGAR